MRGAADVKVSYIPSHLKHMLFELLKNSFRAVVERYGADADNYPPILVVIADGMDDITIKISDEGGGFCKRDLSKIWTYMYTTAADRITSEDLERSDFGAPLAGLGYGLPLSRCYARYFGGDISVISMQGYGTDAFLYLRRLSDSQELLK